jgi:hypothetical protein
LEHHKKIDKINSIKSTVYKDRTYVFSCGESSNEEQLELSIYEINETFGPDPIGS